MQIFVELLNEGTICWRPVDAEQIDASTYRILTATPEGEIWSFQTGDIVSCIEKTFTDGTCAMVASIRELSIEEQPSCHWNVGKQ